MDPNSSDESPPPGGSSDGGTLRERLAAAAADGDPAAIAELLLAEGAIAVARDDTPDGAVLGRTDDLLAQRAGDALTFVGWVAALANGVLTTEGIEAWARSALTTVVDDPATRQVLWSEIGRGDLVVGRGGGAVTASIAVDGSWGIRLGSDGLERVAHVDLVDLGAGPYVLRDKLWFWSSYGAATEPEHLRWQRGASGAPEPVPRGAGGGQVLWAAGALALALLALVAGVVAIGGSDEAPPTTAPRLEALFPLDQLVRLSSTAGGTDLRWCVDGVPGEPYDGDLVALRFRTVDVYAYDDRSLLVDVDFLEPLDGTMATLGRHAVRGYALDRDGLAQGMVQVVEVTPSGDELRGRLTLDGELVDGDAPTVAAADHFQFLLDTTVLQDRDEVVVAVDSLGGEERDDGALPCHTVIADAVALE